MDTNRLGFGPYLSRDIEFRVRVLYRSYVSDFRMSQKC